MKQLVLSLLIVVSTGTLIGCQQITPLTPPNPVVGNWIIYGYETYHLPAWYVEKSKGDYKITPTDTIYSSGFSIFNVHSFTFTPDNTFSELYPIPYPNPGEPGGQTDTGTWSLADSVVRLNVANDFPKKLTYSAATDQLRTDIFPQTSTVRLGGDPQDAVTVSYTIRWYYRRAP